NESANDEPAPWIEIDFGSGLRMERRARDLVWSPSRQYFLSAAQLRPGDVVQYSSSGGRGNDLKILSIRSKQVPDSNYDLGEDQFRLDRPIPDLNFVLDLPEVREGLGLLRDPSPQAVDLYLTRIPWVAPLPLGSNHSSWDQAKLWLPIYFLRDAS